MEKLPHHPFEPSLEELEQAINRRKATLIEKVQADERVKKLEFINSRERVTMKVLKKNEEAFLRAVDISKQQFSDSCEAWLNRVDKLLSTVPRHAKGVDDSMAVSNREAQSPQVCAVYKYPPPPPTELVREVSGSKRQNTQPTKPPEGLSKAA